MISLAPLILFGSSSFLQVMRTCIKARMRSNFGQIPPPTTELAALERQKNQCLHFLAHLRRRLKGELFVYPCSGILRRRRRPPFSNLNISEASRPIALIILSEASFFFWGGGGGGEGCMGFWCRSVQNSSFHGNRQLR